MIDVKINLRSHSHNNFAVTLFWDTPNGEDQEYTILKGETDWCRVDVSSLSYVRGFLELCVLDDDRVNASTFAVRRGTMKPLLVSEYRPGSETSSNIVDTSGHIVGKVLFRFVDDENRAPREQCRANIVALSIPVHGTVKLERYDRYLAKMDRMHSSKKGSNGRLVDIMRSVVHLTSPFRTPKLDATSKIPRWYYSTEGHQISNTHTRLEAYEGILRSIQGIWFPDPRNVISNGFDELTTRQGMMLGAQMCQNHHAWSHYVTDKAGRRRMHGTDTWNQLRGTAFAGSFGKDCDDGAIESHATFQELRSISSGNRILYDFTHSYCCLMVVAVIRPDGIKSDDGSPAGLPPREDPVHHDYDIYARGSAPNAPKDNASSPTRVLHMYCLLVRNDAMRTMVSSKYRSRLPELPEHIDPSQCDAIMVMESTETFPCDSVADAAIYKHRNLLASIARSGELEGGVRVPESHTGFTKDDFYRSDIHAYSAQLLKRTGIAVWDLIDRNTDTVGTDHMRMMKAANLSHGGIGELGDAFGIDPYETVIADYYGGGDYESSSPSVRYFVDSARILPSLPSFVTGDKRGTITARVIATTVCDEREQNKSVYIPMWCARSKARECEDLMDSICRDSSNTIGCTRIDFGSLGTVFTLSICS